MPTAAQSDLIVLKRLVQFIGISAAFAAILYPPYMIPVVNERRWGAIWSDVPNSFGALHVSDHVDWLVLGLELGSLTAAVVGALVFLAKRD
jgi:hypothetical protein